MTRPLPTRANLTQLKHQAKDLLRARRNGDEAACGVLRHLHRFENATDDEILAADVALNETQYALSMEYGFPSWDALKKHIDQSVPTKIGQVERTDDGATVIAGLEKVGWGGGGIRENSVIACLVAALNVMDEPYSYEELMGFSGAAFRLHMAQPRWCPGSACAPCGFDCRAEALKAVGYAGKIITTNRQGKQNADAIAEAQPAVVASIDAGRPVPYMSEESGLIVGYTADNWPLYRPYAPRNDGYAPIEKWPREVMILTPADNRPDRLDAIAASLKLAVTLAETPEYDGYASGFAAYEIWADQLEDDSRFEGLDGESRFLPVHANGYVFGSLWDCRLAAEKYLRIVAADLPDAARPALLAAADLYEGLHKTLGAERSEFACAWSLMPWHVGSLANWTPQVRKAQAKVLRELLEIERKAIGQIEKAVAILDA